MRNFSRILTVWSESSQATNPMEISSLETNPIIDNDETCEFQSQKNLRVIIKFPGRKEDD